MVETYWIETVLPFWIAGVYFQRFFTIAQAALSRRIFPLDSTTVQLVTEPASPTT
jgi:hypothetical protein